MRTKRTAVKWGIVALSLPVLAACQGGGSIESGPAEVEIVEAADGQASDGGDSLGSAAASVASDQDQEQSPAGTTGAAPGSSADEQDDEDQSGGPSTPVQAEAETTDVVLAGTGADMSGNPRRPDSGWGTLTVDRVYSTLDLDGNEAGDGRKWVAVEFQLLGGELGTLWQSAFRLQADGEWYSPANDFSVKYEVGEVLNGTVIFSVPREAAGFTLEGGVPEGVANGRTARFDFSFDPAATGGGSATADDGAILLSDDGEMSGNPTRPGSGWGILTVDRASSVSSIDGNDAGGDNVFVAVEFQLLGGQLGTLWQSAFRLQADGEWYSPVNDFSVQYEIGEVVNGTVIFVVPRSASDFVLEGGSADGRLTAYALTIQ